MGYRLALAGAHVAITGAGRGIGRASAIELAGAGAGVAIGDVDLDAARRAAAECGAAANAIPLDVADLDSTRSFVEQAERELGPLDVLVANAGLLPLGPFVETDPGVHRRTVEVNLLGPINCAHAALPGMLDRGRGRFVIVGSLMGRITVAGAAVYGATKHAVAALGETLREELRGTEVEVVSILPAIVRTEASSGVDEGRLIPAVDAEDVASAVVSACEDGGEEISVPRWAGPLARTGGALPPTLLRPVRWALRGDRAMDSLDAAGRASYARRLREDATR